MTTRIKRSVLDHMNLKTFIFFTLQKEIGDKQAFLDLLIPRTRVQFNSFAYLKPVFSGRYLHFISHHNVKKGIVHFLQPRAKQVATNVNKSRLIL